jgi:hypothetical protein
MNLKRESGRKSFKGGCCKCCLIALGDCLPIVGNVDDFKLGFTKQRYGAFVGGVKLELGERGLCHRFLDEWSGSPPTALGD